MKNAAPNPPPVSSLFTKSAAPAARQRRASGPARWAALAGGAILVSGLAAFGNTFDDPFVFQDGPAIVANESIRQLSPLSETLTPPAGTAVARRPLPNVTLALNYAVGGLDVRGYHAVNLALHLAAAWTLFGLVRRTLLLPRWNGRFNRAAPVLALAAALLWTVHPLQTASVTSIVGRAEVLWGLCLLLTLYCYVRGATSTAAWPWYLAALAACAAGMACDRSMVVAPVVALLYDRTFLAGTAGDALHRRWPVLVALAASWIVLAAVSLGPAEREIAAAEGQAASGWEYVRSQPEYIVRYLRLCLWPHPLVFDYGRHALAATWRTAVSGLFLLGLLAGSAWLFAKRPWVGFLGLTLFLALLPSVLVPPVAEQIASEQRMYAPLAAVVMFCVLAVYCGLERLLARQALDEETRGLIWKVVPALLLTVAVVGLAYVARQRNQDYRGPGALWYSVTVSWPTNARAHLHVGQEWLSSRGYREAEGYFTKALELDAELADAARGLGDVALARDQAGVAARYYTQAIRLRPDSADAYHRRGAAQAMSGRHEAAVADFDRALQLDPRRSGVFAGRGASHSALGKHELALADFDEAVRLGRRNAAAYYGRGNAYAAAGQVERGIQDFTEAIVLRPDYAEAYVNRAALFSRLNQSGPALDDYSRAIGLQPGYIPAYYNRAVVLAALGRHAEALADVEEALHLDANYADGYQARAMAKFRLGDYAGAWADVAEFRRRGRTPEADFLEQLSKASGRTE